MKAKAIPYMLLSKCIPPPFFILHLYPAIHSCRKTMQVFPVCFCGRNVSVRSSNISLPMYSP